MQSSPHLIAAALLVVVAVAVSVPAALDVTGSRPVTVDKLTIPDAVARPSVALADLAIKPLVQECNAPLDGNPFALRERGARTGVLVPAPPPPRLSLPEPPLTPFAPGR